MGSKLSSRWFVATDTWPVLDIERRCFRQYAWTKRDIVRFLRHPYATIRVVERYERVLGFMAYEMHDSRYNLLNLAVHPEEQGTGVGTHMIQYLASRLCEGVRTRITTEVREDNLHAQLFFRRVGFKWVKTLEDYYEQVPGLAAFHLEYKTPIEEPCVAS